MRTRCSLMVILMVLWGCGTVDDDTGDPMPRPPTYEEIVGCHYCESWSGCFEVGIVESLGYDYGIFYCGDWQIAEPCVGGGGVVERDLDGSLYCVLDGFNVGACVAADVWSEEGSDWGHWVESECPCFRQGNYAEEQRGFYDPANGCYWKRCHYTADRECVDF